MVVSSMLTFTSGYSKGVSDEKIEEKARGLGMHFNDECKVFFEREEE